MRRAHVACIAVLVCAIAAASANAAITVASTTQSAETTGPDAIHTISGFTVSPGSDRKLVLCVSWEQGNTAISATWNGSETFTIATNSAMGRNSAILYLDDPTATTANIVVTFGGNTGSRIGVMSLTGAVDGVDVTSVTGGLAGSLTTTKADTLVVGVYTSNNNIGSYTQPFANLLYAGNSHSSHGIAGYQNEATAGLKNYAWTDSAASGDNNALVGFAPVDTTPPTLASGDIVDNKSGGPVATNEQVTYTLTFSEILDASTVELTDFTNALDAALTIDSVSPGTDTDVFTVLVTPTTEGDLQLRVKAGSVADLAGNAMMADADDDTTITVDGTAPTLASSDIGDDAGGGSVAADTLITYTVSFSEDMDASTVTAADFGNAGSAVVSIGTVSETSPGVFSVPVTPTRTGTLQLQVNAGAVLWDAVGNPLDTGAAIADDTTLTVTTSVSAAISVINTGSLRDLVNRTSYTISFNAGAADKLVVSACNEGQTIAGISYDGAALTFVPGTTASRNLGIWYLDNPYSAGVADLVITGNGEFNSIGVGIVSIAGSRPGYDVADNNNGSTFVNLTVSGDNSFVFANMGANHGVIPTPDAPLIQLWRNGLDSAEGAAGYANGVGHGVQTFSFSGSMTAPGPSAVAFGVPDTTAPTLSSGDIADDKGGGPVQTNVLVTYTVSFSEDMNSNTVTVADFGNAGTAAATIDSVTETGPGTGVFTVQVTPTGDGTLQLRLNAAALLRDAASNAMDTASAVLDDTTITVDGIAPTLAPGDIVDDQGGAAVPADTLVTYTVTFSEDMDASTVSAADFGNAGSAIVSIGTVTETGPGTGVFEVQVTPLRTGTLQLQVNTGADLRDAVGNALDTTSTIADNTTLTVIASLSTLAVVNTGSKISTVAGTKVVTLSFDAGAAADKLIVQVSSEKSGEAFTVTYQGAALTPVAGTALGRNQGVFYLDTPYTGGAADLTVDMSGVGTVNGMAFGVVSISGSIPGVAAGTSAAANSVSITPGDNGSVVVAGYAANNHNHVTANAPLAQLYGGQSIGSAVGAAGYEGSVSAALQTYTFTGGEAGTAGASAAAFSPPDTTAPTLASSDIVDNQGGGPIDAFTLVTYTVTFSEDMDDGTVSAADFGNSGTATFTVGTVTETAPGSGVFSVPVTPTSNGTLALQVNAGTVLRDAVGNALDTTAAITDDTSLTINPAIAVVNTAGSWSSADSATYTLSFDAGAADKLIVSPHYEGSTLTSITYNGVPLTQVPGSSAGVRADGIWYLDDPYTGGAADIVVTMSGTGAQMGIGAVSIAGSAAGYQDVATGNETVELTVTEKNSLVYVGFGQNQGTAISADSPLTRIAISGYDSMAADAGYETGVAVGQHTFSATGNGDTYYSTAAAFRPSHRPAATVFRFR